MALPCKYLSGKCEHKKKKKDSDDDSSKMTIGTSAYSSDSDVIPWKAKAGIDVIWLYWSSLVCVFFFKEKIKIGTARVS